MVYLFELMNIGLYILHDIRFLSKVKGHYDVPYLNNKVMSS